MIRAASLVVLGALIASPAAAAGWTSCSDSGGLASFDYFAGDDLGFRVSAVTVTTGERVWASDPANGPGDPVYVGQFFDTPSETHVGAIDEFANTVAELKLFKASEGDVLVYGGILRIAGYGVWAASCSPSEF
jgi:hypothetical protein